MKEFIHHKVQLINNLIVSYNDVQMLYVGRAYEFDGRFIQLLGKCKEYFETYGTNIQVAEVLNITGMFETAGKGINPFELKKVSSGRRELKMMVAYHGLEKLLRLLNLFYEKESGKLEEAEEILSNLVLSLYQSGVLDNNKSSELTSVEKIEAFWKELLKLNGSITVIDKKLRLKVIPEDIYLILEKIISKIS
jgi:hypothetical protein